MVCYDGVHDLEIWGPIVVDDSKSVTYQCKEGKDTANKNILEKSRSKVLFLTKVLSVNMCEILLKPCLKIKAENSIIIENDCVTLNGTYDKHINFCCGFNLTSLAQFQPCYELRLQTE